MSDGGIKMRMIPPHPATFIRIEAFEELGLSIAAVALIFGNLRPLPAVLSGPLFGRLDAVPIRLQGASLPVLGEVPVQLVQALPYALTVVWLAGFIERGVPPKAIGVPYTSDA